ncbi:MAG TPA: type IV toxin-antitoxin system AbiEi family antitoxin domain-containing protein [Ktedonobacterales bacterium]|jgi:predicted transcriptional regulator of viral defense system
MARLTTKREGLSDEERARQLIQEMGVLRPRDLAAHGISPRYASRLAREGLLERVERGLYTVADGDIHEYQTLAEVSRRMPHAVICLLSALRFNDLTTQAPFEVWVMVDLHAYVPRATDLPVRVVYASDMAFTEGIEEHHIMGVVVRVTSPAKTVADCFKYRSKVGLDVALEALRETWRERRATMDELWRYAQICRVARVMRPYLESLETLS